MSAAPNNKPAATPNQPRVARDASLDTPARAAAMPRPQTRQWRRLIDEANARSSTSHAVRRSLRDHLDAADRAAAKRAVLHATQQDPSTAGADADADTDAPAAAGSTLHPDPPSPSAISDVPCTPPAAAAAAAAAAAEIETSETAHSPLQKRKQPNMRRTPRNAPSADHAAPRPRADADGPDGRATPPRPAKHTKHADSAPDSAPDSATAGPEPVATDGDWQERVAAFNALAATPTAAAATRFAPVLPAALRDLRSSVVVAAAAAVVAAAAPLVAAAAARALDLRPVLQACLCGAAVTKGVIARANRDAATALLCAAREPRLWDCFVEDGLEAGAAPTRRLVVDAARALADVLRDGAGAAAAPPPPLLPTVGLSDDATAADAAGATDAAHPPVSDDELLRSIAARALPRAATDRDAGVRDAARALYAAVVARGPAVQAGVDAALSDDARARLAGPATGGAGTATATATATARGRPGGAMRPGAGRPGAAGAAAKGKRSGALAEMIAKRRAAAKKKAAEGATAPADDVAAPAEAQGEDVVTVSFVR